MTFINKATSKTALTYSYDVHTSNKYAVNTHLSLSIFRPIKDDISGGSIGECGVSQISRVAMFFEFIAHNQK